MRAGARAYGALFSGFANGIQIGSQVAAREERTKALKDANDRTKAQDKAFAELADVAEGYVGTGMPAPYQPSGAAGTAARFGVGAAPTLPDIPIDASAPQAMPAAQAPQQQTQGPKTPEQRLGYSLYRSPELFQLPQFYNEAAKIMLKTPGLGQQGLQWLDRGAQMSSEGVLQATKRLVAGDPDGATQIFNSTGERKIVPGSLKPLGGGKWTATFADSGQTITFDPVAQMRAALHPSEYLNLLQRENADKARAEDRAAVRTEQATHNRNTEDILRMNADTRRALGAARLERGPVQQETALQRNTRHLVSIGAAKSEADAYQLMRQAGGRPEREGITALAKVLLARPGYTSRDGAARAFADATEMYRSMGGPQQQSPQPAPGEPRMPGPAGAFKSADDVKAAFRAGRLPRDQAESILRDQFGYGQ